ncbi:hypothetical protein FOXG_21467 [Fusarium oxysporum f. sp. lycopersici 4287]|uniref:Uncharacterized protein n=1 Tax=Fusarium oxysporum f. sp. lycopersici (strain 4287 / CBS 123668 / FGSC 9935 / NRRL 34936) TaxID=426428 RepID=A0A0J9VYC4_FUSO4|nr:hypothetical protein FOXG_21467 [Fusarium oxysporum f. sp. lycopersici 4287]EWZ77323.1 hypothetical protein FOWG_18257 [Fusarium oxysporum f. sp. lycopersici MN25]KAJ9413511.1 hypothetical protein QL093DRAFT_2107380 [Fusarium oxysporum]KNB15756.1 hypothetical protein FOXG_21467 [Fusarium oxysporum f. sp. lycopersici 4287]
MGLRGRNLGAFALLATASLVQLLVQTVNAASKPYVYGKAPAMLHPSSSSRSYSAASARL